MVSIGDKITAAWGNRRPAAASGSFFMPAPSALNTPVTQTVTFPAGRFATAPMVVATVLGSAYTYVVQPQSPPTTTSVQIGLVQTSGTLTSRLVHWIAVENT